MNVLLFGYDLDESGYAGALYFLKKGYKVRITDLREESTLGPGIKQLKEMGVKVIAGANRVEDFEWADIVIKSPAISPENPILDYAKVVQNDFTYLFENENVAKIKLICISGTKDKTITVSAVCHALKNMGKKARTCGTIDSPVFSELDKWENGDIPEYLVCKMSSWEIRDTYLYSGGFIPAVELALITSINVNVKYGIFGKQTKFFLCSQDNVQNVKENLGLGLRKISIIESQAKSAPIDIPSNLHTSYAVLYRLGFKQSEIHKALKSFKGVPRRVEIVKATETLLVIDDSTTTIPEAIPLTLQNLESHPIHLICGGSDQHLDAKPILESCKSIASLTLLDGSFTKKKIIPLLKKNNIEFNGPFKSMQDAVDAAKSFIDESKKILQVLILCPGASAIEYFNNESDRGNQFKECFK